MELLPGTALRRPDPAVILFAVSCALALALCAVAARRFSQGPRQFWAALAALVAPWGLLANLGALSPPVWLAGQAALLLAAWYLPGPRYPLRRPGLKLRLPAVAASVAVTALGYHQWRTPIALGDDTRYHASRVLYWLGNQSIAWFPTHNDRHNVFGYQGELAFLWPVLFTRSELAGRIVFWLAVPLAVLAVYHLTRLWGGRRRAGLLGAGLFLAAPIVLRHGTGLKPELWSALFVAVTVWWMVTALRSRAPADWFMAGVYAAFAVHTKSTALVLLPVLFFACRRRWAPLGFAAAALATGIVPLALANWSHHGHPMGPLGLRKVLSEPTLQQFRTHAVRLPLLLTEFPSMPVPPLATAVESAAGALFCATGADAPLPLETGGGWPGAFEFRISPHARNFSLGGLAMLFVLAAGLFRRGRTVTAAWAALAALFLGIGLLVRWQVHSALPERMLIPCFALAMGLLPVFLPRRADWLLLLALLWTSAYSLPDLFLPRPPIAAAEREWPFHEALDHIPAGSRILLFADQDTPDYPLFGALEGFTRQVVPWGKRVFNPDELRAVLGQQRITHVLLLRDTQVYLHWDPPLSTAPFASALRDLREIPLQTPAMRLFALANAPVAAPRPRQTLTAAPMERPLLFIDPGLRAGIDTGRLVTPWPIEDLGPEERGFLWLGSGPAEGLRFSVEAPAAAPALVEVRLYAGPSRAGADRNIVLQSNSGSQSRQSGGEATLRFPIALQPGRNDLVLYSSDAATNAAPGGDTRNLIAGLRELRLTAQGASAGLIEACGWEVSALSSSVPIENLGAAEGDFLWLGSVEFLLTPTAANRASALQMKLSPGPSLSGTLRNGRITINGRPTQFQIDKNPQTVRIPLPQSESPLKIRIEATGSPSIPIQPNGDTRPLLLGLHEIRPAP